MSKTCKLCGRRIYGQSDICRECGEEMFESTPLGDLIRKAESVRITSCTKDKEDTKGR